MKVLHVAKLASDGEITIAVVEAGTEIFVTNILGPTLANVAIIRNRRGELITEVDPTSSIGASVTFTVPTVIVATLLRDGGMKARHIRFAMAKREGVELAPLAGFGFKLTQPGRLGALTRMGDQAPGQYVRAPGGDNFVLLHQDEVFIPDHVDAGSSGWVLRESVAEALPVNKGSSH